MFGRRRVGDWKEHEGLILARVPLHANCSPFITSVPDGDFPPALIRTHTHVSPSRQRAKSCTGHNRPIGHGCCCIANGRVCSAEVLLPLALKQFSAWLVGYASAPLMQSLCWSTASTKGFLHGKSRSIHPMEKSSQGDPTGAQRISWDSFLPIRSILWYSCP